MLHSKTITDVIQFLNELIPLRTARPQTLAMIRSAIAMPISQVTCQRSLSKMKIINTCLRNLMTDQRLSNLTILAAESAILVDYKQFVDIDSLQVTKIAEYYCAEFLLRPCSSEWESLIFMHTVKSFFTYVTLKLMKEQIYVNWFFIRHFWPLRNQ